MPVEMVPPHVNVLLEPGGSRTERVVVPEASWSGSFAARLVEPVPGISLVDVLVERPVQAWFTEAEILELPPFPPGIRQQARETGYFDYVERGRGDGSTPLPVVEGDRVAVELRLDTTVPGAAEIMVGTLLVEVTGADTLEVPIRVVTAAVEVRLAADTVTVHQGDVVDLPIEVVSLAGPDTDVVVSLTEHPDWWVPIQFVALPRGSTVTVPARLFARPDAPIGTWPSSWLAVSAHSGLFRYGPPLAITVLHGRISVRELTTRLVGIQGRRTGAPVRMGASGYGADVRFRAASPPAGVTVPDQTRHVGMSSTSDATIDVDVAPDSPLHVMAPLAVGWAADGLPFSGSAVFNLTVLPHERTFHQVITTPSGTALGGWVEITVRSDGTYRFRGHMHGSGFDPYSFRIIALVRSATGRAVVAAQRSGTVGGTLGGGSRDHDWSEEGTNPGIGGGWDDIRLGSMEVVKSYEDTGVLGVLGDIAGVAVDWLAASVLSSPMIASFYVLGRELGGLTGVHFGPPNLLAGLAVKGGVVLVFGPSFVFWAMVAGVATGLSVEQRSMTTAERAFADRVFHGTIDYERIVLTNLERPGDRKFALPHVDGRTLIGLGEAYDNPTGAGLANPGDYEESGRLFVHELTHAWQIEHGTFTTELFWDAAHSEVCNLLGSDPYAIPTPLPAWPDLNLEQQASLVDQWYGRHKAGIDAAGAHELNHAAALADLAFPAHILTHLWSGQA